MPRILRCGNHFPLEFPFSEDPSCGMFTVYGCSGPGWPIVYLEKSSYHILGKISTNKFKIFDTFLGDRLRQRDCFPFTNVSLPKHPSISFTILSNLTLFTCYNRTSNESVQDSYEYYHNFYRNQGCGLPQPAVYYSYPTTKVPAAQDSNNIPTDCGVIQLPINSSKGNSSKPLDLLTAEYTLEWTLSKDCYECYRGGGHCHQNSRNGFYCEIGKDSEIVLNITTRRTVKSPPCTIKPRQQLEWLLRGY